MDRKPHWESEPFSVEGGMTLLFDQERSPMVRMATLMIGSSVLAEEVVQDAFAGMSQRWADVDHPGAYLRRSVVNGCAQILRRRSVEDRYNTLHDPARTAELPPTWWSCRLLWTS